MYLLIYYRRLEVFKANLVQMEHLANPRMENQNISIHIHESLYELQLLITSYFCAFLIYQSRMAESWQDLSYIQEKRFSRLDWSHPGEQERKTISFILRKMKQLLENETLRGRQESPNQLLIEVLSNLWTYFLFNERLKAAPTSHDQEWREIALSNRIEDCEFVAQILQQQTALLQQNEGYKEDISRLNQPLGRILHYLKHRTIRRSQSRDALTTSHDEDKALEDLDWILR